MCTETSKQTAAASNDEDTKDQQQDQQQQQDESGDSSRPPSLLQRLVSFYWKNEFLLLIITAILLARAYPPMGANYLQPDITSTWIAVCLIFVLAGLTLKTEEFSKAFKRIQFNVAIQLFNFGVISGTVYAVTLLLEEANFMDRDLLDGMVICACLPMTINMVVVLTKTSGGDEAAAIFNTAFGNMMGVFLSPLLILGYLGVEADVELWDVFYKLALRVILPVFIGQVLQKTSKQTVAFVKKHKPRFKSAQQYALVFLVYCIFSRTFDDDSETSASIADIFLMIVLQFILLSSFMVVAWYMLRTLFRNEPELRVMGLYGCTHKTVAMGVPLINAIYEDNDAVGLYTLPLLIWHPMQLVIGTFLSPRLQEFVEQSNKNKQEEQENEEDSKEEEQEENGNEETGEITK